MNHVNRIRISFLKWYAQRAIYERATFKDRSEKLSEIQNTWLRIEKFTGFLKLRGESTAPFFKQINPLTRIFKIFFVEQNKSYNIITK